MGLKWILVLGLAVMAALLFLSAEAQQDATSVSDGDWPHFNRDAGSSRYSPLSEINTENVTDLELAWSFTPQRDEVAAPAGRGRGRGRGRGGVGNQVVPVVVDGVMYVPAGNLVLAVDGDTGEEIWRHQLAQGSASSRGVNYWPGDPDRAPRIVFISGSNLIALDAATGEAVADFGTNGVANMGQGWNGVPAVVGNILAVGAATLENPVDPDRPGDTRGFDAISGDLLWTFHTVPRPGEVGHETWLDDGWQDRSGTNVWFWHMTSDPELGLLYMPIGSPASNYYGGDRPGANLFGNSVVAVDAQTGEYRWHFQTVHHDLWDFDNPPAPVLLDVEVDGETIPALVQTGKIGWMFILDRRTGEPIFGVEERPVPAGDVPGEWYSPTQPFPVKPPALARMSFSEDELVTAEDTTPEHAAACRDLWDRSGGFYNEGPYTPFLYHEEGTPPRSTLIFPGATGGTNWGGMATDQELGYVFAYTQNQGQIGWTEMKVEGRNYSFDEAGSELLYTRASVDGGGPFFTFSASAGPGLGNLPCQKPPWGQMNAVDANTGEIVWQTTVGLAEGLPEGKQNTGLPGGFAGPTATGGGLLFYGALRDGRFRAFDSRTGEELWTYDLDATATAQPMSYTGQSGKQYVAIVAGGAVRAFALP